MTQATISQVTIIEPQRRWVSLNLRELWRYRDLLWLLVWRDFSATYRQSVLGVGWAIVNPVVQMVIYTIVFGGLAKLPSDGIPYPVFNFAGLLPWLYFSTCLTKSSISTVTATALITKVYFPRLILPLATVVNGLIDFSIQFVLLLLLMASFGVWPTWGVVFLPVFLLLCSISALSVGMWASALAVKYRDVQHLITFASRMWMWLTPIVYSVSLVPVGWRTLYSLNPMVGVIEGFRWAMLGKSQPDWTMMAVSTAVALLLFVSGLYFFRRTEATFADVI